jgi:hypothetical protein
MFKAIKIWWMYWRYRNVTQRRQRLQMWWNRQRRPSFRPGARPLPYRERGTAVNVYRTSGRSWAPILVMVAALAALQTYGYQTNLSNTVLHGIGGLILVLGVYAAMRTV